MRTDFEELATEIKEQLEKKWGEKARDDYAYREVNRLVDEFNSGKFTAKSSDIGAYAVKMLQFGQGELDEQLSDAMVAIGNLYRRRSAMAAIENRKITIENRKIKK